MQIKKSTESYKVGDIITSPSNEKYEVQQRINKNKKPSAQQALFPTYQHTDTFIVKKQSTRTYLILKRFQLGFFDSSSCIQTKQSVPRQKNFIKDLKGKILFHPNLLNVQDVFLEPKVQFNKDDKKFLILIEQYCEEGDLAFFVKRQQKKQSSKRQKQLLHQKLIAKWLLQILLALQHLHFNKLTHQFLNPANIYLTPLGNLKLNEFYLLNSISTVKQIKKTKQPNSILDGYEPLLNQKKFKINERKDIFDFSILIAYFCNSKIIKQLKKELKTKNLNNLPSSYSQDLNNIYILCLNVKKTGVTVKDILKTPYFLEIMRDFIIDKKLNVSVFERIPIKKYTIHKKISSPNQTKKSKQQEQKVKQNQEKLPRIDKIPKISQSKNSSKKIDKTQSKKEVPIDAKKLMRASLEKLKIKLELKQKQRNSSRQRKIRKNNIQKGSQQKQIDNQVQNLKNKPKILTPLSQKKGMQKNSLLPPPPSLKRNRQNEKKINQMESETQNTGAKSTRQNSASRQRKKPDNISRSESNSPKKEQNTKNQFKLTPEITFGKKLASKEDQNSNLLKLIPTQNTKTQQIPSKQTQLQKISQNLAKIFLDLKIRQDDDQELSFQLDEQQQQQLRLTLKQQTSQDQGQDNLMKTYKSKFDQIISELQEKYQPNMETIIQKTNQWDSNEFFVNKQLLKRLKMQEGQSLLPSIQGILDQQYNSPEKDTE